MNVVGPTGFLLDKCRMVRHSIDGSYSISEAVRIWELIVARCNAGSRRANPRPNYSGPSWVRLRFWTEKDMAKLREYKAARYWGKRKSRTNNRKPKRTVRKRDAPVLVNERVPIHVVLRQATMAERRLAVYHSGATSHPQSFLPSPPRRSLHRRSE